MPPTTSAWPACSSMSTELRWAPRTRLLPMRPTGTPALIPNGAHTLTARARDTDNKTTLSALVNVTVANSDYFQNQVLATGFDLPTTIEFLPDGRMLVAELAGKIKVLPPPYTTPDPTLFLQITNIAAGGCAAGHLRHRARSRLRHQPPLLRLLHARDAHGRSAVAVHGQRRAHRHGARAASSSSTRIPGRLHRAPWRGHHLRQRREALLHDRRPLRRDTIAGPDEPARKDPPHRQGRVRADSTTRSTTAPGRTGTRSGPMACATRSGRTSTSRPTGSTSAT